MFRISGGIYKNLYILLYLSCVAYSSLTRIYSAVIKAGKYLWSLPALSDFGRGLAVVIGLNLRHNSGGYYEEV